MEREKRPLLVSHNDIDWIYYQKFGEYISPLKIVKHYSSIKEMKTIDSLKSSNLKEK
jgi:hypothetical protein